MPCHVWEGREEGISVETARGRREYEINRKKGHMASPKEMYEKECRALGVPPNSGLLRMLPESTVNLSGLSVMHLGRNFLGDRGVVPFVHIIAQASSLHTLNLRENGIGNEGVKVLCRGLRRLPALKVLELSGNPFTFLAARQLVYLCEDSAVLSVIGVEGTLMTEKLKTSIIHRIREAVKRREKRKQLSQQPSVDRDDGQKDMAEGVAEAATTLQSRNTGGLCLRKSVLSLVSQDSMSTAMSSEFKKNESDDQAGLRDASEFASPRPPLPPPLPDHAHQSPLWFDASEDEEQKEEEKEISVATAENDEKLMIDTAGGISFLVEVEELRATSVERELRAHEEMLPWQVSRADDPLRSLQSTHTRIASHRTTEKRSESGTAISFPSSFTLELRTAEAEGKLAECTKSTKGDDFLDLLFGSGVD
ncbi:putative calpain-like cysteine peptidase [Trypanosoma cruzi]|nr:putative calpain-like cysteine peptidase [Trypanosoma cruzi]